jgi:hypothetical protein
VQQIEAMTLDQLRTDKTWSRRIVDRLEHVRSADPHLRSLTYPNGGGHAWIEWTMLLGDSFLKPLCEPTFAKYLLNRVIDSEFHAYLWDGLVLITSKRERDLEEVYAEVSRSVADMVWPTPYEDVVDIVEETVNGDCQDLIGLFLDRVQRDLVVDDHAEPTEIFGTGKSGRIVAYLARKGTPVHISELEEVFGKYPRPDPCLIMGKGMIGLPRFFPEFNDWTDKVVPVIQSIMREKGPDRQWLASELLARAQDVMTLPEWLTPWVLVGMIRQAGAVADLGRQRVALIGVYDTRLKVVPSLVEYLENAGGPVPESVAREAVLGFGSSPSTYVGIRTRPPLFPTGDGKIGLIGRDLPGGEAAINVAGAHLERLLRSRNVGLTLHQALLEVHSLSVDHAKWTQRMLLVVPRVCPALRSNRTGIGLTEWESVRVRSVSASLADMLAEHDGRVSVETYVTQMEQTRGVAPSVGFLSMIDGVSVVGGYIMRTPAMRTRGARD